MNNKDRKQIEQKESFAFSRIPINQCKNNDRNSLLSGKHRSNSCSQQSAAKLVDNYGKKLGYIVSNYLSKRWGLQIGREESISTHEKFVENM